MILTNYYGYQRLNDFSAQGSVFDHRGVLKDQKTDLPIIVINWLNGQMISRETDVVPVEEMNKAQAELEEVSKQRAAEKAQEAAPRIPMKKKQTSKAPTIIKKKKKKKAKKKGK